MDDLIPYDTILAAKSGDGEAMSMILRHYAPYIASYSKHSYYDETGSRITIIDDYIRQSIEAQLMVQIIFKFDPSKLPNSETLDMF